MQQLDPQYGQRRPGGPPPALRPRPGRGRVRKRGHERPETPEQLFVKALMKLADPGTEEDAPFETQIEDFVPRIQRELRINPELVKSVLLDCAVELSTKTPQYATLIGLLNADESEFVQSLVEHANEQFSSALEACEWSKARMLLRLLVALTVSNVVAPSSIVELLGLLVDAALTCAKETGKGDPSGRSWQPWSDYLVYIVLMALPWGGIELAESAPAEVEELLDKVGKYMEVRPLSNDPALRPFNGAVKANDLAARSDSGGASFLGVLWTSIQELKNSSQWKCRTIMRMSEGVDLKLAAGQPIQLPKLTMPKGPIGPNSVTEAAADMNVRFPPRGGVRLLAPQHTEGDLPGIERIILEEYILDTLNIFHEDRATCTHYLLTAIPQPFPVFALIAETIFSQMLMLPKPVLKPIAYTAIIVTLCRTMDSFPRGLSGCVRELFTRVGVMDPELRDRLAEWLAFHLSNLQFTWPWEKWKRFAQAPPEDPQRRFLELVISKLTRISWLDFVKKSLPEEFHTLLPPYPLPKSLLSKTSTPASDLPAVDAEALPSRDATGQQQADAANDVPMEEADQGVMQGGNGEAGDGKGESGHQENELTGKWEQELRKYAEQKTHWEEVKSWVEDASMDEALGGVPGVVKVLVRGILIAGHKSTSHTRNTLERYLPLLQHFVGQSGAAGREAVVEACMDVWQNSAQRSCMVLDRLVRVGLISEEEVVGWVFSPAGVLCSLEGYQVHKGWEVLHQTLDGVILHRLEMAAAMHKVEMAIKDAECAAERAALVAAEAAKKVEQGDEDADALLDRIASGGNAERDAHEEVENAKNELDDQKVALQVAKTRQEQLLLQVYRRFASILASDAQMDEAAGDPGAVAKLLTTRLASFCRKYAVECAPIVGALDSDVFPASSCPPGVRELVFNNLRLGRCEGAVPLPVWVDVEMEEPAADGSGAGKEENRPDAGGGQAQEGAGEGAGDGS
eukprot:evm.model.scf_516.7 EVM.evm.TU.scf_516.7   scf_516:63384-73886(+)